MNRSRLITVVSFIALLTGLLLSQSAIAVGNPDYSDCVPTPLPTTPVGSSFEKTWTASVFPDLVIHVVAWRIPCSGADSAVLLRVTPISEMPFVCSSNFEPVIQNAIQYNSTVLVQEPGGSPFCAELFIPATFLLEQWPFRENFNDDAAFSLYYQYENSGAGPLEIASYNPTDVPVDLSGTIKAADGSNICAMVLASGQYTFSCNPAGVFSLTDLPSESDGTVKRQIYADGFFPEVDTLTESSFDAVAMTRSGTCPNYNTPYDPGVYPDSAGKWIDISGSVLLQDTQTPICAMVLANGKYMFSCDGTGSYALNIPLDSNGQFKLQVYADGFAPTIQTFDEFQPDDDVRMARAVECQ